MSMVGSGFGSFQQSLMMPKRPVNPLDKSTIVSVYPKTIQVEKPTIFPGSFTIPAAPRDKFSILVVGPSSWWKDVGENQPFLEIPTNSMEMARSIVDDFLNGLHGATSGVKSPGLFYIPGNFNELTAVSYVDPETGKTFKELLDAAVERQRKWYLELVMIADSLWARTNGNPLAITDDARMAAEYLGLSKPWVKDFKAVSMVNCRACGNLRNPAFPICSVCKSIEDPELAKTMKLSFAV